MFNKFKKNIYSQHGEDGIIEEILSSLDDKLDKTCCEFGAWNGIYLSNCYNLIKNKNYSALLIEADKKKYKELCKNIPDNKIIKLNKFVDFEGSNSLDNFLEENNFNINFDFLSMYPYIKSVRTCMDVGELYWRLLDAFSYLNVVHNFSNN